MKRDKPLSGNFHVEFSHVKFPCLNIFMGYGNPRKLNSQNVVVDKNLYINSHGWPAPRNYFSTKNSLIMVPI